MKTTANDDSVPYEVVVPHELSRRWQALPSREHELLAARLDRAAASAGRAPTVWPAGPAGEHRGRHRAQLAGLWVLYRLDDAQCTVSLLGFGRRPRAGRSRRT